MTPLMRAALHETATSHEAFGRFARGDAVARWEAGVVQLPTD